MAFSLICWSQELVEYFEKKFLACIRSRFALTDRQKLRKKLFPPLSLVWLLLQKLQLHDCVTLIRQAEIEGLLLNLDEMKG